ncbi:MAG: GxxExxY protein [Planctomycetota bacterium]
MNQASLELTEKVIGVAMDIHTELGPGLLEHVYEIILARELERIGMRVQRQLAMPVEWRGEKLEAGYRIDLLVEDVLIVEVKSVERGIQPVHVSQVVTYLKLSGLRVGLIINFNVDSLRRGLKRVMV